MAIPEDRVRSSAGGRPDRRRVVSERAGITRTSGVLMIVVGILMITNYFTVLAATLQQYTPESLRNRL